VGVIILMIVGGIFGWLAGVMVRADAQQDIWRNIIVGASGALVAGLLVSGHDILGGISVLALVSGLVGATVILAVTNLFRGGPVR
jgi:uncharacterized membrane protein YeaQ/YmgE (transglycosylase-associated protein family)